MAELKTLHQTLIEELGKRTIERTEIPVAITDNLNKAFIIRPYQFRTLQFFLNYWEEAFEGRPRQNHQLLFHMATGSGKTLIMAGLILYLYNKGYRNFLFFVNSTNIIDKTRNNFLNPLSTKFLFDQQLSIGDKRFVVRETTNFQSANEDDINIVFSTIQGLHLALNTPRENGLTYDDFENQKIVLISDEAHHINADTKKGAVSQDDLFEVMSWEGTVKKIFEANPDNVLLEFTATVDFNDENIKAKYLPKLIYDYPLKEFRKDGYSKEVKVLQADLPPFERALQAVLLSQYRRKIFEKNRLSIKPVILFKSKTIKDSKEFFEQFKTGMETLTPVRLAEAKAKAEDQALKSMFVYLEDNGITLENLATELRGDFTEDKLIEVNSKDESELKQLAVNSLEDATNEYRAVFAVDKLNEGWDVLNLFDIVRLYDTRDSKAGKIGKTTMSEAQLIGRGARYCPFGLSPDQSIDQRKYDADLMHEMRICEELIYHSAYSPKYIQELNTALHEIGIKAKDTRQREIKLKPSFTVTPLYKAGHIFLNRQQKYDRSDITGLDSTLVQKLYKMQLHTGYSQSNTVFEDQTTAKQAIEKKQKDYALSGFGLAVLRKAMQRLEFYQFKNLKAYLPNLKSTHEFLTSSQYIGKIKIEISGTPEQLEKLTPDDKLRAATMVLEEISTVIASDKVEFKGTKEFKPFMIKDRITNKTLNFAADEGEDQEFGKSMNNPDETAIHLDLSKRDWFVFDDCFGTSEEKLLIKFIDKHYAELKKKYSDVYLIRNERHFKIYNFDDGRPLEPDFVLYMVGREKTNTMHYQVFIEPKGGHLLKQDQWKEDFLLRLQVESVIDQLWKDRKYVVWGLPFYNEALRLAEFKSGFDKIVIQDNE